MVGTPVAVSAARRTGVLVINLNKIKTPALQKGMEFYLMGESPPLLRLGWLRALLLRNCRVCPAS